MIPQEQIGAPEQQALGTLAALAQKTRLEVYRLLCHTGDEGLGAGEIARILSMPHNTLSSHLAILQRAGIVTSHREGRNITYYAVPAGLSTLMDFLEVDCPYAFDETN